MTSEDLHQRAVDRLTVLRHELQIGESRLHDIEREETMLRQTVLRIGGAIQVLEEVLGERVNPADREVGRDVPVPQA